jgi:hypothetical protein
LAADRSSSLEAQSWSSRLLAPCLSRNRSSGHFSEWDAVVSEAHTIAVGEEQLWQGRGLAERLEGIETRLAELLETLSRPQDPQETIKIRDSCSSLRG